MTVAEQAQAVADYWKGHPEPLHEPATPQDRAEHAHRLSEWEKKFGPEGPPPPPKAPSVPGPISPGAGMAAARAGDLTNHGSSIGPATTGLASQVFIASMPAACMGDPHLCPMVSGPKAHVSGTIAKGSPTVFIGGKPAARVADATVCSPEPGMIAKGEPTVLIGERGGAGGTAAACGSDDETNAASGSTPAINDGDKTSAGVLSHSEIEQAVGAFTEAARDGVPLVSTDCPWCATALPEVK